MSAFLLILLAIISRVVPHTWFSFTAVGGGLLFFGARRPLREAFLPLAALIATDYYLTVHVYGFAFETRGYLLTWAWYAAVIVLGHLLLKNSVSVGRVATAALMAPTSFFLMSNFAVWAGSVGMYPHTMAGLATCYAAGLPFYRNDVIATALVSGLAFGIPELLRRTSADRNSRAAV